MAITKRQSLFISAGALGLFFLVGALFLRGERRGVPVSVVSSGAVSSSAVSSAPPASPAPLATTQPLAALAGTAGPVEGAAAGFFTLHSFERSEVRDGKKLWEVKGSQAQYFPETSSVTVTDAELLLLGKSGKEGQLQTKFATLFMQGPALTRAILEKGVTAIYDHEYTLTADKVVCDRTANTVVVPGPVQITSSAIELSGDSLKGDIDGQEFVFSGNVVTVIKPHAKLPSLPESGSRS